MSESSLKRTFKNTGAATTGLIFDVWRLCNPLYYIVNLFDGSCTCRNFLHTQTPCKHIFAVLQRTMKRWADLPHNLLSTPWLNIDREVAPSTSQPAAPQPGAPQPAAPWFSIDREAPPSTSQSAAPGSPQPSHPAPSPSLPSSPMPCSPPPSHTPSDSAAVHPGKQHRANVSHAEPSSADVREVQQVQREQFELTTYLKCAAIGAPCRIKTAKGPKSERWLT
ncbi:hypothetical protein DUNSADRAFT_15089 [Dunaliella salina]|uniref:SWIM-type domain-containing protein n=1 Tax=Dunaliella salina TaxID=3046 RepID=A0ABQ7G623_DUNSA|nr:hypothetical protein DUNSADRAFT_15089 [Dunaliella salina]|eukprot:KAF5830048.1 hypothetical protein DUNSADRAFT_15089 [Dunaliella salina]